MPSLARVVRAALGSKCCVGGGTGYECGQSRGTTRLLEEWGRTVSGCRGSDDNQELPRRAWVDVLELSSIL